MPKLFWGQPANGSLLVQLNFMTSKTCAQVFLITQELCKEQKAGSGTGPHHKFFSAACRCLLCSTRVLLCSFFPRGDYWGVCSVFLRSLQRWLQWRSQQYNDCPQSWLLCRAPSCPSCHQRHRLTHEATTHSLPWKVFATASNEARRSFSNSTFILCEVQRDTGRVTDYVNSASGQTRQGEISIIWRRLSGDTALGQYGST